MNTLKTMRNALLVAIAFAGVGWYGGHRFENVELEHVWSLALRGHCAATDIDGNRYWYQCQDAYIAAQLQAHDSDTSTILDQMRVNQPKKVGGKARP